MPQDSSTERYGRLAHFLSRLSEVNRRLRIASLSIVLLTVAKLVMTLFGLLFRGLDFILTAFVIFTIVSLAGILFDQLKRQGVSVFEAISDELERRGPSVEYESLQMEARYLLRSFSRSSDLPLVPGKFGVALW